MAAFWFLLRNFRLLLIPMVNFAFSLPVALMFLYPFCLNILQESVVILSIMLSMTLAFSTDYSLFLLRKDPYLAVFNSFLYSGNIILTSGSVLFITFAFLMTYKSNFLVVRNWPWNFSGGSDDNFGKSFFDSRFAVEIFFFFF